MLGQVKFVGGVDGKPGRFVGVELNPEFASKGKNNGDVAGKFYFRTSTPGAGVFVPLTIAEKVRRSASSSPSIPATPTKPGMGRPSMASVRSPSIPNFRSTMSAVGAPAGRRTPTFARSVAGTPRTPYRPNDRPPSRAASEIADRRNIRNELEDKVTQYANEKRLLEKKIRELEKQITEQANALDDMQQTMAEFEAVEGAKNLRAQLRDKNETIASMAAEFDQHRADFRSTLDTLEMAASETERMYEERVRELEQANQDLQDRGGEFEQVASQLKQLEDLVSELEDGLEDARRGEAEASGEAEFLRGEVERNRLELKREREKAANALKEASNAVEAGSSTASSRDLEQKEDEIRGLKAIIHSLSRGNPTPTPSTPQAQNGPREDSEHVANLERRMQELEGLIERKTQLHEELERENEVLRTTLQTAHPSENAASRGPTRNGSYSAARRGSERSIQQNEMSTPASPESRLPDSPARVRQPGMPQNLNRPLPAPPSRSAMASDRRSLQSSNADTANDALYCDLCEVTGHDILTCTNMFGAGRKTKASAAKPATVDRPATGNGQDADFPAPLKAAELPHRRRSPSPAASMRKDAAATAGMTGFGPAPGKASGVIDESKWCALCERDGHESIDCPFDD